MTSNGNRFDKFERYFRDVKISLETASKCGKSMVHINQIAAIVSALEKLVKELKK